MTGITIFLLGQLLLFSVKTRSEFYISLGDKESKTKNKVMASVEANTLKTVEYLKAKSSCTFEWNQGGHFNGSEERMAKAFLRFLHSRK